MHQFKVFKSVINSHFITRVSIRTSYNICFVNVNVKITVNIQGINKAFFFIISQFWPNLKFNVYYVYSYSTKSKWKHRLIVHFVVV